MMLTDDEIASSDLLKDLRSITKEYSMEVTLWSHCCEISPPGGFGIRNCFMDLLNFTLNVFGFRWKVTKSGNLRCVSV